MKATSIFALLLSLCLSVVPSLVANQCRLGDLDLPIRHAGEKLQPTTSENDGTSYCSTDDAAKEAAIEKMNRDVSSLIDGVLPQLQDYLNPSPCNGIGWSKVAFLDMKNASQQCPSPLVMDDSENIRTCRLPNSDTGCYSLLYSTNGRQYNQVCGKVISYQYGTTEAFTPYVVNNQLTINDAFVDGVVITRGSSREHIWTFAAGIDESHLDVSFSCPCLRNAQVRTVPPFVGTNYFCESGVAEYPRSGLGILMPRLFPDDPLWDGSGCGPDNDCCVQNFPPYFTTTLDKHSCDDIEVRVCINENIANENIHIEVIELYVK